MRYEFIETHQESWPVGVLCEVLDVSRSGYYAWANRPESARSIRQGELVSAMREIHGEKFKDSYGSPRMHKELLARGHEVSENTVAELMQAHDLRASTAKKFKHTTDSNHSHPVAKNVLNQEFDKSGPNEAWVSDITYVPTREGWLYLACVVDLYSRKVVGWSMSERMTSSLVISALVMALEERCPQAAELLHHSDRGSQYASEAFQREVLLGTRNHVQHEPHRQLLRQCVDGELFCDVEERTGSSAGLPDAGAGPAEHL